MFNLQFPTSDIPALAAAYEKTQGAADDEAFAHAAKIVARAGAHTKETRVDLLVVMRWKSGRRVGLLEGNTDEEVFEALDIAMDPEVQERTAIAVLRGLDGVDVRMASAILTALQGYDGEECFTILDVRALESLGVTASSYSIGFYLDYLDAIFQIKEETGYSLRMIDRALWQWSANRSRPAAA
jgi:hypothetical protein